MKAASFILLVSAVFFLSSCSDSGDSSSSSFYVGTWYNLGGRQVIGEDSFQNELYDTEKGYYVPQFRGGFEDLGDDLYETDISEYFDEDTESWKAVEDNRYDGVMGVEEIAEDGVNWLYYYLEDGTLFGFSTEDSSYYSYEEEYSGKWWSGSLEYDTDKDTAMILWLGDGNFEFIWDDENNTYPLIEKGTVTKLDENSIKLDVVYENDGEGFKLASYTKDYSFDFVRSGNNIELTASADRSLGDINFASGSVYSFED